MDKKQLTVAIGALSLGVSQGALADNPFNTTEMQKPYAATEERHKMLAQVCGAKDKDGACNAKQLQSKDCNDPDYQKFKAFKNSKYFQKFQNTPEYQAFEAEQKQNVGTTPKSKSSSCSTGSCGGG